MAGVEGSPDEERTLIGNQDWKLAAGQSPASSLPHVVIVRQKLGILTPAG
jgi:hypothetical protein